MLPRMAAALDDMIGLVPASPPSLPPSPLFPHQRFIMLIGWLDCLLMVPAERAHAAQQGPVPAASIESVRAAHLSVALGDLTRSLPRLGAVLAPLVAALRAPGAPAHPDTLALLSQVALLTEKANELVLLS